VSDVEHIRDAVGGAISQAVAGEAEMVTRWVVLAEVLSSDGERACYCLTPEDARAWDTLGLLTYGVQIEQAGIIRDAGEGA
jgi:hypothetical protein